MMPNTRVSPAARRNSITTSCSPFSACSMTRIMRSEDTGSRKNKKGAVLPRPSLADPAPMASGLLPLQLALPGIGVLVVREHRLLDLHHPILARPGPAPPP